MYCYRCGNHLPDSSAYCPRCGNRLGNARYGGPRGVKIRRNTALIIAAAGVLVLGIVLALLFVFHVIPTSEEAKPAGAAAETPPSVSMTATPSPSPEATGTPAETQTAAPEEEKQYVKGISNDELLDYFCDIGLHIEYGDNDEILKRWEGPIRISVKGDYTEEDYETLTNHIDMLNSLGVLPEISFAESDANFFVYFIPLDEMDDTIPGYEEGNWGYFNLGWDWDYIARQAYIGVVTDVTTQEDRNHLILEEVTQALGLMNDSPEYSDSIFQVEWTQTQSLSDIDTTLIRMMYCDELKSGMKLPEVRQILSEWLKEN